MFSIDPAPRLPESLASPPEFQQWLNKTFPNVVSASTTATASSSSSFNNHQQQKTQASNNTFSNALMIIPSGSSTNQQQQSTAVASRSGATGTTADLQSASAAGGSLVVLNQKAIEQVEAMRAGGGQHLQTARAATVEDFNAAFRKAGLARLPQQQQQQKPQQQADQQRRRSREQDEHAEQQDVTKPETDTAGVVDAGKTSKLQQQIKQLQERQQQQQQDSEQAAANNNSNPIQAIATARDLPVGAVLAQRDHLGRSFTHCPASLAVAEIKTATALKLPSKMAFAYRTAINAAAASASTTTASTAAAAGPGVTSLTWVPPHGHLFVAGDISGCCSIYEAVTASTSGGDNASSALPRLDRLAIVRGHAAGVREVAFPAPDAVQSAASPSQALGSGADRYLSCAPDMHRPLILWDTERCTAVTEFHLSDRYHRSVREAGALSCAFVPPSVHSGATRGDTLCVSGMGQTVVVWDVRTAGRVIDLEGHLSGVHWLYFAQYGRALFSCGEDKTVRLWDLRSNVAVQEFSESAMHSVNHLIEHPISGEVFVQSNDDRVRCMLPQLQKRRRPGVLDGATHKYRFVKDREFRGHTISGTGCRLALSRTDGGNVLSSGDTFGNLWMFQTVPTDAESDTCAATGKKNGEVLRKFRAHAKELTVHQWHPVVPGMVVTGSRDGLIKVFK